MTDEEALKVVEIERESDYAGISYDFEEAMDRAIEALKEKIAREKGG